MTKDDLERAMQLLHELPDPDFLPVKPEFAKVMAEKRVGP